MPDIKQIKVGTTNYDILGRVNATDVSTKLFLVGANAQSANPTTNSDNEVYVTNGQLDAKSFRVNEKATMQYNSTTQSIDFSFN